ncbi:MAG: FKBP-type peptidyl-prolyl cis-trans isomerase [Coriobacteriales bacterium]|jgi:FKBP-type peptidyl-prolyl cis-trans isomerase 2|nr:FKBP-type peptidyl-prolyl cis-trans isomerase [Coriobacteriales bacterium]
MKNERVGRVASILYRGGVKGEEQVDDRSTGEPLQVVLGENAVPRGIEALLYELEPGEEREIEIAPEEGYGYPSKDGRQWYPRTAVHRGRDLKLGDVIACPNKYDRSDVLPGRVVAATDDLVQIDVNHPFAGKTLHYWVKLVALT